MAPRTAWARRAAVLSPPCLLAALLAASAWPGVTGAASEAAGASAVEGEEEGSLQRRQPRSHSGAQDSAEEGEDSRYVAEYKRHVADLARERAETLNKLKALELQLAELGASSDGNNGSEASLAALQRSAVESDADASAGAASNAALLRSAEAAERELDRERSLFAGTAKGKSGPRGDLVYRMAVTPFWQEAVFKPGDLGVPCFRIPAVTQTPNGTLIVFAEARYMWGQATCNDNAAAQIVARRSFDGGHSWERAKNIVGSENDKKGNPNALILPSKDDVARYPLGYRVLLIYALHDKDHVGAKASGNGMIYSDDDGASWSREVDISASLQNALPGPGTGAVITKNGRIIVALHHPGHLVTSDDHGKTWTVRRSNFYDHDNEPTLAQLPNGAIWFSGRQWHPRHGRGIFQSKDEGLSWNAYDAEGDVNARPMQDTAMIGGVCENSAMTIGDWTYSAGPAAADRGYLTIRRTQDGVHWDDDSWLVLQGHAPKKDGGYSAIANGAIDEATGGIAYEGEPSAGWIMFQQFPLDLKHHCLSFIVQGTSHPENSNGKYFNFDRSHIGMYDGMEDFFYATNLRTGKRGALQVFSSRPRGVDIPGNSYGMWRYGSRSGDWQVDDVVTTCSPSDKYWRVGVTVKPRLSEPPLVARKPGSGDDCLYITVLGISMCEKFANTDGQWFLFNREEVGLPARAKYTDVKVRNQRSGQDFVAEISTASNCGSAGNSFGFSTQPAQASVQFKVGDQLKVCGLDQTVEL
eukprot:TRINITY_DN37188_c0_g1_i1.p1 TRINITY_DN37188_c0_g1~~TRINITY_DN37188_c0_g1_i1.p1  ORF type:complete len:790 (+),score=157.02 TRINITY_DN37188_c0_g1_i1:113-2371(+)